MHCYGHHSTTCCASHVVHHHVLCRHRIEIEVLPASAEAYFLDERFADPVNTQVRFEATVYNAPASKVLWKVADADGGPGAGAIDQTGLYTAPPKGALPHGHTDIIIATAVDDPMRKAYATVVLIGKGPEPQPSPKVEVFPRKCYLYYRADYHNNHIDESNKMQLFRASLYNTDLTEVKWFVDGSPVGGTDPWYLYQAPNSGSTKTVVITAKLMDGATLVAKDEARAVLINYSWPGIV